MNHKVNKTENIKEYNKKYMSDRYKNNPLKCKLERNTNRLKKNNNDLDSELFNIYKYYLSNVVKITKLYNQLPSDIKSTLIDNINNYDFNNINLKI